MVLVSFHFCHSRPPPPSSLCTQWEWIWTAKGSNSLAEIVTLCRKSKSRSSRRKATWTALSQTFQSQNHTKLHHLIMLRRHSEHVTLKDKEKVKQTTSSSFSLFWNFNTHSHFCARQGLYPQKQFLAEGLNIMLWKCYFYQLPEETFFQAVIQ